MAKNKKIKKSKKAEKTEEISEKPKKKDKLFDLSKNDLADLKEKIFVAKKKQKSEMLDNLDMWRDYYRGKQHSFSDPDNLPFRDIATVNMIYRNVSTIVPSVVFKNPNITATAMKKPFETKTGQIFDTVGAARAFEVLMNYYYRKLKTKRQTRKCLLDALIGPWGIMKLGFTAKTEKIVDGDEVESNEIIKVSSIFATRISPKDLIIDPKAKDHLLEDAEWIAFRMERSLEDLKEDPNFINTDNLRVNKTIKTDYGDDPDTDEDRYETGRGLWDVVEYWEVWNKREQTVTSVVLEHNKVIKHRKWPYKIDGFPLEILYFNEKPDELFPISDVESYIELQDELNLMQTVLLDGTRRQAEPKWLSRKDSIDPDEMFKITHGGAGTISETNGNPNDVLVQIKNNTMSQDTLLVTRMLKNDIHEQAGVAGFERGMAEKFDTATEANLVQQGISIAREDRRDIIEDFTVRVVKKLSVILQQTMEVESIRLKNDQFNELKNIIPDKLEKILGREGELLIPWLNLSREDILGDYEFAVELGSMQPINKETRKRDVLTLAQLLQGNPLIEPVEALKRLLDAFEIRDIEKLIKDPRRVAQERQMAQQQALQMEIAKDQPKRDTDLQKTQIKTQSSERVTASKNEAAKAIALLNALASKGKKT